MICQYLDYLTKIAEDGGTDPKGRDGELVFFGVVERYLDVGGSLGESTGEEKVFNGA